MRAARFSLRRQKRASCGRVVDCPVTYGTRFTPSSRRASSSVPPAAASAVAVPIALAAVGTLLPLIMFASFGAIFAATAAAMVALTVLGPLLLSFSFFGGMSFVAVAAKAAIIVPSIIIGSTIWAIASFGLKRTSVLGGGDGTVVDEEAKFENINAVGGSADDEGIDDKDDDDASSLCSSIASSTAGPKDRVGALKLFLAKLEEEEFEIRSRKSKFPLKCAEEEKVAFVSADVDGEGFEDKKL